MLHPTVSARLQHFIALRYQQRAANDLIDYVFANHLFHSVDSEMVDFLFEHRAELAAHMANSPQRQALAAGCIRATKRYTYQRNQFIHFPREYERLLHAEYQQMFAQLGAILAATHSRAALLADFAALVQQHHQRLRAILTAYCAAAQPGDLADNPLLQSVPCDEYSPALQLQVLGLDFATLREPILDVGCGSGGRLVRVLRRHGYAAFGIDRFAPAGEYFIQGDWFGFDYTRHAWGTIIAHHTLSTHFLYSHGHQLPIARRYSELYMRLLGSLAVGGTFCYAPGVPFFEAQFAEIPRYQIRRTPIALNDHLGISRIAYSTAIQRLG